MMYGGRGDPFFVAEISANHLGDRTRAVDMVRAAAKAGATAVKFQTFDPERLVGNLNYVLPDGPWRGRRLVELYEQAWTPKKWLPELFETAREVGVVPFSSPFSPEDVDALEAVLCPIYKIASMEITDLDLIRYASETRQHVVISTGMAKLSEIEAAVDVAIANGADGVTVLKCTSGYPAPLTETNLATVPDLADYFGQDSKVAVGISDHTVGPTAAIVAVSLGATMVEKHFTIPGKGADRSPDAAFSADPETFAAMVRLAREAALVVGEPRYGSTDSEASQLALRRALYVVKDVAKGEKFTRSNLRPCRPGLGRPMLPFDEYLDSRASRAIAAGTIFEPDMSE